MRRLGTNTFFAVGLGLVGLTASGIAVAAEDEIRIGGYVQGDFRGTEAHHPLFDGFQVRRARLEGQGVLQGLFHFKVEADVARSDEPLQQGWVEYAPTSALALRVGLFKVPYCLEKLNSSRFLDFTEPSLPGINFNPFIDTGAQLGGELSGGRFGYALTLFNGEGRYQTNRNEHLQYGGRLFTRPFSPERSASTGTLHLGLSLHREGEGNPAFSSQVTALGTTVLQFADSVSFDGARTRWGAEAQYARGPVGFAAEYLELRQDDLARNGTTGDQRQSGGYVSATWLVTGERKVQGKAIQPAHAMSRSGGGAGAWELAVRYDWLETNPETFADGFATGTAKTQGFTGGVHLWPSANTRALLDVYHYEFETPVVQSAVLLDSETGVIARLQLTFQATVFSQ